MTDFIVTDPSGREHIVTAPPGATQEQALEYAKSQFGSTTGGAATGNPNLRRQGDRQLRDFGGLEPAVDIGAATTFGGALGAASSEILGGAGRAMGAVPQLRPAGKALEVMGNVLKSGGRTAPTIAGAVSGGASETAGQSAELAGAGPVAAEGARIAGGFAGGGVVTPTLEFLKRYAVMPSFTMLSKAKKEAVKLIIGQVEKDGPESLTAAQKKFIQEQTADLRGGAKTDAPLDAVGLQMENYGGGTVHAATLGVGNANSVARSIGNPTPAPMRELADTGADLRTIITNRNSALKEANESQIEKNKAIRDQFVSAKESSGQFINKTPEFEGLVNDLKSNLEAGKRAPDVQGTYKYILSQIESGGKDVFGQPKPLSFQALDDVRRNLGEVFRGKPPEGYAAIGAEDARKYYGKISEIQKKYAGSIQEKLLDDYARGKEGLEPFISAKGRKATALDRYDDSQFVTDASKLPDTYFKTREGVRALKELTGDPALVNKAAQEYVNKKLEGATAEQTTKFLRDNAAWLEKELPLVRNMIAAHADRLAVAERGVAQARAFADEAASTNKALIGGRYPADRVRNLVISGDADLWAKAGPAIAASPQGKANVLSSVRQVLADAPVTVDKFNRTIRPALKGAALADDAALDMIEAKLRNIQEMKIPESEKLGWRRRIVLQSISGYTASGMARGTVEAAKWVPN